MRMIPSTPLASTQSAAELKVFQAFERLNYSSLARCFHSLRLSEHEYKREGELDFVLLAPQGLYVFEVKGGGVSRDVDGRWMFQDRYRNVHAKKEGPFDQAHSGMYSLVNWLAEHMGGTRPPGMSFGYGVIFPDCTFATQSVEWPAESVLDAEQFAADKGFERYLQSLVDYWQGKKSGARTMSPDTLDAIEQLLRPRFDIVPNLHQTARNITMHMESLTQEQYAVLDTVESNPRILCSGGAGTGKTFLAAEIARRHAFSGQNVLFVCRSPILLQHLRSLLPGEVQLLDLDALIRQDGNLDSALAGLHDVLVVDEGQDLFTYDHLDILERRLRGGFANGIWRFFYDANNQGSLYPDFDVEALSYLQEHHPALLELKRNCRNTRNIVLQIQLLTLADLGTPIAGPGPQVDWSYYSSPQEAGALLATHLDRLIREEVPLEQITILSPDPSRSVSIRHLPDRLRRLVHEIRFVDAASSLPNHIQFSSIRDYKGMENQFVIMADIEQMRLSSPEASSMLYVGMSRARSGLVMLVERRLESEIRQKKITNLEQVGTASHGQ